MNLAELRAIVSAGPAGDRPAAPHGQPTVHLVGAGPGAADLLTLRAARLLASADIVLHDALVSADILALAPQARLVPVGKRCGRLSSAQSFINKQLVDAARRYRTVVRLKGGDPMLFGRAQEEIDSLTAAGVAVEVVPGISAAFGAAGSLQRSLSQRGVSRSVTFITPAVGTGQAPHDWAKPAVAADTVVLYMASRQAGRIAEGLLAAASRPAALVENATLPNERVVATTIGSLGEAAERLGSGPALILVGDIYAGLAQRGELQQAAMPLAGAA